MQDSGDKFDIHFYSLVSSLHMAAMQQMGKIASPISGKIERDLKQAQTTIAMLDMLKNKTEGNLSQEEKQLVDRFLYELRMNYVDEAGKGEQQADQEAGAAETPKETESDEAAGQSAESGESHESTDDSETDKS